MHGNEVCILWVFFLQVVNLLFYFARGRVLALVTAFSGALRVR